jgi:hypothetical protein
MVKILYCERNGFRLPFDIEATTTFLLTLTEGALFALGVLLGVLQVVGY